MCEELWQHGGVGMFHLNDGGQKQGRWGGVRWCTVMKNWATRSHLHAQIYKCFFPLFCPVRCVWCQQVLPAPSMRAVVAVGMSYRRPVCLGHGV